MFILLIGTYYFVLFIILIQIRQIFKKGKKYIINNAFN